MIPARAACLMVVLAGMSCTASRAPTTAPTIDEIAPAIGATDPSGPVQIVVWSSRPLPGRITATARTLPGVIASGPRGSGIVDLRRVRGATRPIPRRPTGAVVPISVTSIAPSLLRAFPDFESAARVLARGDAILHRSSALFRGLDVGDAIALAGGGHTVGLRIGAIVDDGRLFRSEVVVPDRAGGLLALKTTRSLVLAVTPDTAAASEKALKRAIRGFPARIRAGTVATGAQQGANRQLSLLELKETFGEFWYRRVGSSGLMLDPAWVERSIVYARVPVLGVVRCNASIVPMIEGAMTEIQGRGLASLVKTFDGCYNPRTQRTNTDTISRHAFGVAFDIDASRNPYGAKPTMDKRIVQILERWGFTWGGRWRIPDGMHFEFSRYPEMLGG